MTEIRFGRAYAPEEEGEGYRVYVDRLWPRGLSHETFHYDAWDKEIAPSDSLRHWFHDNPDLHWEDFEEKYRAELKENPAMKDFVASLEDKSVVTLLYSSKNEHENNAIVLANYLISAYEDKFRLCMA